MARARQAEGAGGTNITCGCVGAGALSGCCRDEDDDDGGSVLACLGGELRDELCV